MEIDVSIVIPTKNGAATLKPCLDSIYSQSCDYSFEIIAVDSGSQDNTIEILKNYGCIIKSIEPSEFKHGYARNLGADCSKGRFIIFINQDAIPADSYWLKELIKPLSEEYTAATYSRQVPYEDAPVAEKLFLSRTYPSTSRVLTEHDLRRRSAMNIVFLSTVSCAIRRDLYARYRFSNTIIMGEDQELAIRLLKDGYGIKYVPSSVVTHSHNYSLLDVFKRYFDCGWCLTYNKELSSVKSEDSLKEVLSLFAEVSRYCYKYGIACYCFSLVYTLMKILGFSLGLKSNLLPHFIRNKMSYTVSKIRSR